MGNFTKSKIGSSKKLPQVEPTLWELLEAGDAPHNLKDAAIALTKLRDEGRDAFIDELCNDASENYPAIEAAFAICRAVLDELEELAKDNLAREAAYHRNVLAEIEGLGVL